MCKLVLQSHFLSFFFFKHLLSQVTWSILKDVWNTCCILSHDGFRYMLTTEANADEGKLMLSQNENGKCVLHPCLQMLKSKTNMWQCRPPAPTSGLFPVTPHRYCETDTMGASVWAVDSAVIPSSNVKDEQKHNLKRTWTKNGPGAIYGPCTVSDQPSQWPLSKNKA